MVGELVRLLGQVQFVAAPGRVVELPSASLRRLLAVLALSGGQTVRGEYLVDLLGVSPGALRTSLCRLRSRIGPATVRTESAGYRLACGVDIHSFDALMADRRCSDRLTVLDEALGLWHGQALEEFRHETWAEAEASRLDELHCVALEDRAELLIGRHRPGEAVALLEAHVARHPLRDRTRALLMEALAGDGRQADALRAFHCYREFLADETGTEPSAHVRSIERRVAASFGAVECSPRETGRTGTALERPPSLSIDIPLPGMIAAAPRPIGRSSESTALIAELALTRGGTLRTVHLTGHAAAGRTALVADFARASRASGATVLYGRSEECPVPLQPFRSIVRTVVEHAPLEMLQSHAEVHGGELVRLAPQLRTRLWVPAPVDDVDAIRRFHLFEAVADLIRRLAAAAPTAIVLDDLHRADPTALQLMGHIATNLLDSAVLLVLSYRPGTEPTATQIDAALTDVDRGRVRRIALDHPCG